MGTGSKKSAFTLLELIIALALLAILMSTAIAKFVDLANKALGEQEKATMDALRAAVLLYKAHYNIWPIGPAPFGANDFDIFDLLDNPPRHEFGGPFGDGIRWGLNIESDYWRIYCPHMSTGAGNACFLPSPPAECEGSVWHYQFNSSGGHSAGQIRHVINLGHH